MLERSLTPELQSFKDEYVSNMFAIKVETQQAYDEVIDKLDKLGYTWRSGVALKDKTSTGMVGSLFLHTRTHIIHNEKSVQYSPCLFDNSVYKTYKSLKMHEEEMNYSEFLERQERIKAMVLKSTKHLRMEKNNMNNIHFIETIAFNKKTFKTTMVLKYGNDEYDAVEVISNKKDFVDFRVGFLLAYLKFELHDVKYKALIHELFRNGKPRITFLQGYASRFFDNFRQMNKVLDAIKSEKDQVNIGGRIIKLVWKE